MRIALFVHCFFPTHFFGTEAYTLTLARELQAAGHDVTVVSATLTGEPPQPGFVHEYVHEGVPVVAIDKNLFPNAQVRDTYEQPELRRVHERILRRLRPDVVHVTHLISHTTALLDVTQALGIPTFATLTDFFGFCFTNRLEDASGALCAGPNAARDNCMDCFLKLAAARPGASLPARLAGIPQARPHVAKALAWIGAREPSRMVAGFRPHDIVDRPDHLHAAARAYRGAIAPTLFLKQAYESNGWPAPLRLAHFGIDIDRAPKPQRPDGPVRLGFIGQLVAHKGPDLLLDALRAAGRPDSITLTLWGAPEQDRAFHAELLRKAEGLPARFAGTVARAALGEALAGLDYLVIPSTWYENSPLILLQALATHTPVIVSDVLGMTEFVEDGRNGFVFARGDAGALAAILRRLADDPGLAARLSVQTRFERTPADMAADVLSLYAEHGVH